MRLIFQSTHLSIDSFVPTELPSFTVLTGENGSGKSHLLDAIINKKVLIEGLNSKNIVLFNYESFRLDNESPHNATQLTAERESVWQFYVQQVKPNSINWRSGIGDSYRHIKESCASENTPIFRLSNPDVDSYKSNLESFFDRDEFRHNYQVQGLYSVVKKLPYAIDELTQEDFNRHFTLFMLKNDFLPTQLGRIFWDYYIKYRGNQVNEFQNEKHGKNYEWLSEEAFFKQHGRPPWIVINEILATFDTLKYRVPSPEGLDYFGNFHLKLNHTEKENLEIDFSNLSSGERVLMALVASVYKASSDKKFPSLLMLDEVDASLHPSMMKNMLDVFTRIFIKHGVNIILITHSPTTLALSPDESIFVMNRTGSERIVKKNKSDALAILTQGFATIDQGLKIFDQISKSKLTIVTEGYNAAIISRILEMNDVRNVDVLTGIESLSGKNQLKSIFEFFCRVEHKNKILFIWDCDVSYQLTSINNTYPYVISKNLENTLAKNGIENAFPPSFFNGFIKTITLSNGNVIQEFDSERKRDFMRHVLDDAGATDFDHFDDLVKTIHELQSET